MDRYLSSWGKGLHSKIAVLPYEDLYSMRRVRSGTYIFSDLDRLGPEGLRFAQAFCDACRSQSVSVRILNEPARFRIKYDLLKHLHGAGLNSFQVFRAGAPLEGAIRFPVFLTNATEHRGVLGGLLSDPDEVRRATVKARLHGHRNSDLLVEEFCDTADRTGLYRKYSMFRIGDRILPAHIDFSFAWMVKDTDIVNSVTMEEEKAYLNDDFDPELPRKIFNLAGIEYGRLDYALLNGRLQTWEINSNPVVLHTPDRYSSQHLAIKTHFAHRVFSVFEDLVNSSDEGDALHIDIPGELVRKVRQERLWERLTTLYRRGYRKCTTRLSS